MRKYGEILFLGRCNLRYYYCLSTEMKKLKTEQKSQLDTHFSEWKNFGAFLDRCKAESIDVIYLSSITTDPILYKYLEELVRYLKENGFKVGVRTNGYLAVQKFDAIAMCDEEISFSLNGIDGETNQKISGRGDFPDWQALFSLLRKEKKKCRVSIVINRYNADKLESILLFLKDFQDVISYVQLRKVYKYYEEDKIEDAAFEQAVCWVEQSCIRSGSFYESDIYDYKGLSISLWRDVFKKESISSVNYFTDGVISTNNLLIPAYEEGETT